MTVYSGRDTMFLRFHGPPTPADQGLLYVGLIRSHKESPNFWHFISQLGSILYQIIIVPDWQGSALHEIPFHCISLVYSNSRAWFEFLDKPKGFQTIEINLGQFRSSRSKTFFSNMLVSLKIFSCSIC